MYHTKEINKYSFFLSSYCQARLSEGWNGLTTLPLGSESVTALTSWRMWTVWMINFLRCAGYRSDTALLEPLMWESQVRVPVGEEGHKILLLIVILKTTGSVLKQPAQASSQLLMWCDPRKIHWFDSWNVSQPKPHHILCDVIQPCSVMYCMKENKRKKSGISPPKK